MLSQAEEDYRVGKFTGSLANKVMGAKSPEELVAAWAVKIGLDPPDPETWAMRAGSHMEPLILDWLEEHSAPIARRGEIVDHPEIADICVKLDGYRAADDAVLDAKFLGPYRRPDEFLPAYYPQLVLQRLCVGCTRMVLVVAQGTSEPVEYEYLFDRDYADELIRRAKGFLHAMHTMTPPCELPPVVFIPPMRWRTVDVVKEPTNWSAELLTLLDEYEGTADAAQRHDVVGKAAKALIPDDVGKCFAGSWQISRSKKGVLTITARRTA
jgi:hypothetical protein